MSRSELKAKTQRNDGASDKRTKGLYEASVPTCLDYHSLESFNVISIRLFAARPAT